MENQTKYNQWTIVGPEFKQTDLKYGGNAIWAPCQCDCGVYRAVPLVQLKSGHSKSCGSCLGGKMQRRLYSVWRGMRSRCSDKADARAAPLYFGRGIRVCDEWQSFIAFKDWAYQNGYADNLQIDRINNDGNYEPSNCRWVTCSKNNKNKGTNHNVTAWGETKCLMDWAHDPRCKVSYTGLRGRLLNGMAPEDAIGMNKTSANEVRWSSKWMEIDGEKKSLADWIRDPRCSVGKLTIQRRIKKGMTPKEAVFTPNSKVTLDDSA